MAPPLILFAAATAVSALGSIAAGNAKKAESESVAQQLQVEGKDALGSSTQAAAEERRQAELAASRAQAVAAASGGGASGPSVEKTISDIIGEGEFRGLVDLYGGETRRNSLINQATATQFEGSQAQKAGYIEAIASVGKSAALWQGGGGSFFQRYGNGGYPASTSPTDTQPWSGIDPPPLGSYGSFAPLPLRQ